MASKLVFYENKMQAKFLEIIKFFRLAVSIGKLHTNGHFYFTKKYLFDKNMGGTTF